MTITIPHLLMFGYWGFAPFPNLLLLSSEHKYNYALIAHEQCHQSQQRRDGWFTFWRRYVFNKEARLSYELEAYKVWISLVPNDKYWIARWLSHNYGFDLTPMRALMLLEAKD